MRLAFAPGARDVLLLPPTRANQDEIEQRFFSAIFLRNGTAKITAARRLDDLNALILRHLPLGRPIQAMDVGVSSGVSTLEWAESFRAAGVEVHLVASDLTAHASLWTIAGALRILTEESGHPLQYELGGLAISNSPRRVAQWLLGIPNALVRLFPRPRAISVGAVARVYPGLKVQRVPLVSPRLSGAAFEIMDDDVFEPWKDARRFDVVRVANVLNPTHFDETRIRIGLRSLRARLAEGGVLALCRTHGRSDEVGNRASLLKLTPVGRFEMLGRLKGGSELEAIALSL